MPIRIEYLRLLKIGQKYKKKKGDQDVSDLRQAWNEEPLIKELFPYGDEADRIDLAKLIDRLKKAVKKRYIEIIEPEDHPAGYVKSEKILGKIGGKRGFNNLCSEIRDLIETGKELKDHSRRIQRDYHLSKEIIEELCNWISKEYEEMTQEEIRQLSEVKKLFKEQKPIEGVRKKERQKPFEFDMANVLDAQSRGILNKKEVRVLKYRFNLNGQGTKSLKLIAGWLEKSPTTIRNIEHKALKILQEYLEASLLRKE